MSKSVSPSELETFLPRSTLRATQASALESHAELAVDTEHPFFFDHALDHLPGLLLITAMTELAWHCSAHTEQGAGLPLYNPQLQARFTKWCLFEPAVQLQARGRNALPALVDVQARQDGTPRCEAHVKLEPMRSLPTQGGAERHVSPCDQRLVNKHNLANVMIGTPLLEDALVHAQVRAQPPGHALAGPDAQLLGTLYLLEAFMQTQRYLNKTAEQLAGVRLRDTLCEVSIELLRPIGRTEPVDIVRPRQPVQAGRGLRRHEGELRVGDERVGHCAIVTLGNA